MQVKNLSFEIDEDKPFENDQLSRRNSAENLTHLIKTIEQPFVLALDSPWGSGKTTFIKMFAQHLQLQGVPTLYFNSWEVDYSDDPLISFIGEIQSSLEVSKIDPSKKKKLAGYVKKAKKLGGTIIKESIPLALKIGTAGALDLDKFTEKAFADFAEKVAREKIDGYQTYKRTLEDFKENLGNFASEISKSGDQHCPLVFFIDELDRCRPNFAVELLERLKHLFSAPGIVFVLAIDKAQISNSIKCLFGNDINTDGYLRRFVDLTYQLPIAGLDEFCNFLYQKFEFWKFFEQRNANFQDREIEYKQLTETFTSVANIFKLSARVVEQCIAQINIIVRTTPFEESIYPIFLGFLISYRVFNEERYVAYCKGEIQPREVINELKGLDGGYEFLVSEQYGKLLEAFIASAFLDAKEIKELIDFYKGSEYANNLNEDETQAAVSIMKHLATFISFRYNRIIEEIVKKIEMSHRFQF